jgi:hypothetical protein
LKSCDGLVDARRQLLFAKGSDDLLKHRRAFDEGLGAFAAERRPLLAQGSQVALHVVGELFRRAQADHARNALERVEAAEQLVEQRRIYARSPDLVLQREQVTAHERQVLVTLGEIIVEELSEELAAVVGVGVGHYALSG